jgi:hypothetical protein
MVVPIIFEGPTAMGGEDMLKNAIAIKIVKRTLKPIIEDSL